MGSSPLKQPHKSPEAQAPLAVPPGRPYPGGDRRGSASPAGMGPRVPLGQAGSHRPALVSVRRGGKSAVGASWDGCLERWSCFAGPLPRSALQQHRRRRVPRGDLRDSNVSSALPRSRCLAAGAGMRCCPLAPRRWGAKPGRQLRGRLRPQALRSLPARPLHMKAGGLHLAGRTGLRAVWG